MRIEGIIWLHAIVEKLAVKHHVAPYEEVEETLNNHPKFDTVATILKLL